VLVAELQSTAQNQSVEARWPESQFLTKQLVRANCEIESRIPRKPALLQRSKASAGSGSQGPKPGGFWDHRQVPNGFENLRLYSIFQRATSWTSWLVMTGFAWFWA